MALHEVKTIKETVNEARESEASQEFDTAIELYQQALKQDPLNQEAYNRLMIIYRKQKNKKQELATINTAIKTYEKFYKSKKRANKSITDLSNKLNKAFGLTDKKGNAVYVPEPIATWQKRKELLEKRVLKKKK